MDTTRIRSLAAAICALLIAPAIALAADETTMSISYEYDDLGRLVAERGNHGQVTSYTYDADGRILSEKDSLNRTTSFHYDNLGRRIRVVDPTNTPSEYTYDAGDNVVSVKDPRGLTTSYDIDGFGLLWKQTSPDTGVTSFTRNEAGLVSSMRRNDGKETMYQYDDLGRPTLISTESGERTYVYDSCVGGKGSLCAAHLREGGNHINTVTQSYTAHGWLLQQRDSGTTAEGVPYDDATSYAYDHLGRVIGITYPSGVSVGYGYTGPDLTAMTATIGGSNQIVVNNVTYRPYGNSNAWTYGNGIEQLYSFDSDGRVIGVGAGTQTTLTQGLTFGFNSADEITAITNSLSASLTRTYLYDSLGRVSNETTKGSEWRYDANGNRTQTTEAGTAHAYNVDAYSNRLTSRMVAAGLQTYGYDAIGNRTSDTAPGRSILYAYDGFNRLRSANVDGAVSTYTFNALDQRVGKTLANGMSSRFIYAGQNSLMAERDSAGWTSYLWLGDEVVALIKPDQQLRYVHNDHLGRPELVTNASRQIVWQATNEAWGRSAQQDAIGGLNLGFPGQYFDQETGLWYNGYRDGYDDSTGSFTQADPIGLMGGDFSTFAYVGGNPISYIDSDGLAKKGAGRGGRDKGKGPGGYRGIGTGGLNSKSDPKDVEQAIKEAKGNNASPAHMKKLRALLKTTQRNMKRALPLIMMEQLLRDQCEMGIPDACEKYCSINPDQCIVRQPQITSIPTLYGLSFTGSLGPVKEGTVNVGEVEVARERPDRENGRSGGGSKGGGVALSPGVSKVRVNNGKTADGDEVETAPKQAN